MDDYKSKASKDATRIIAVVLVFCGIFTSFVEFISGSNFVTSIMLLVYALILNLYMIVFVS